MFLSGCYIFIASPNWQSHSTSELLNIISLVVTVFIVFILLMSLAAGGLALALSVVFLIRSLLEGSALGIRVGKWLLRLSSTGQMRNLEVENKTAATRLGKERSELHTTVRILQNAILDDLRYAGLPPRANAHRLYRPNSQ